MNLESVMNAPWAIMPAALERVRVVYDAHVRGETIDLAKAGAGLGRPLQNEGVPPQIVNGVAVLAVQGILAKRMNMLTAISGGTSTELVARDLRSAAANPQVKAIVLSIDSPGGTVDGTQGLAHLVADVAKHKPVCTWVDGTMASAAYWIGCAAGVGNVYVGSETAVVGSIGVVATHSDISKAEEQRGIKTTEIVAGRFKRVASQYGALTDTGRASLQQQMDAMYSVFLSEVAKSRATSEEKVHAKMADGRVFIGKEALRVGLADGVCSLETLIQRLASRSPQIGQSNGRPERASISAAERMVAAERARHIAAGWDPDLEMSRPRTRSELHAQAKLYAAAHGVDYLTAVNRVLR